MLIKNVIIKGFRNFKNIDVNMNERNLLIGQNDVGKTNFIYALRLLCDRNIPESEIKIYDSDFYAFQETNDIEIAVHFDNAIEDCVVSRIGNYIQDNKFMLLLNAKRKGLSIETCIRIGKDRENLEVVETRVYLKAFCMIYVASNRDLSSMVKKQKRSLLNTKIEDRDLEKIELDDKTQETIIKINRELNKEIAELTYVKSSTSSIVGEMNKLVSDIDTVSYRFSVLNRNELDFINKLDLVSHYNENDMEVGGLGRANQIYFSLWKNEYIVNDPVKKIIPFFFVEEPESHLHPHSQRKLSKYLLEEIDNQILLTTHSPHILAEFDTCSIIRFYHNGNETISAQNGVSTKIGEKLSNLAYRLNAIPAEAFFSKGVLLVEGKSEELFFKAACSFLGIDLDKHNISIVSVEGVGFNVFVDALSILGIPYVMRTDNDIIKKKNGKYRAAGVLRGLKIYEDYMDLTNDRLNKCLILKDIFENIDEDNRDVEDTNELINYARNSLEEINIYIGIKDLENDICLSPIRSCLEKYYGTGEPEIIVNRLQDKKATTMFELLSDNVFDFKLLAEDKILKPLYSIVELSKNQL